MKKCIATLILIAPLMVFSQQFHYGSGGSVLNSENKKVTPDEVRTLIANNTEALVLYNAGRDKKTWGNVLFYGGLGLIVTNVVIAANTDNTTSTSYNPNNSYSSPNIQSERANMTAAIIGGALLVASIPIKIGYPKKIKAAINNYNKGVTDNYVPIQKLTLIASNRQVGLRFEF